MPEDQYITLYTTERDGLAYTLAVRRVDADSLDMPQIGHLQLEPKVYVTKIPSVTR